MSNHDKISDLLDQWSDVLVRGNKESIKKVNKRPGGLNSRIKRTVGNPIVFDADTYDEQQRIQKALCMELPHLSGVIRSNPETMDGYAWTCKDFIELYYGHFRLVISKVRQSIEQQSTM